MSAVARLNQQTPKPLIGQITDADLVGFELWCNTAISRIWGYTKYPLYSLRGGECTGEYTKVAFTHQGTSGRNVNFYDQCIIDLEKLGIKYAGINIERYSPSPAEILQEVFADRVKLEFRFNPGGAFDDMNIKAVISRKPSATGSLIKEINIGHDDVMIYTDPANRFLNVTYTSDGERVTDTKAWEGNHEKAACQLTADGARLFLGCAISAIRSPVMSDKLQSQLADLSVKFEAAIKFAEITIGSAQEKGRG